MSQAIATTGQTVEIVIDGKTLTTPRGATILQTARAHGIYIPTLCYLEKLNPIGSCRICSVEVDGVDGPVMSCVTPVTPGMNVVTQSDNLAGHRRDMMRFILTNHPLDCSVCERAGECLLQNRSFELNVTSHSFKTNEYVKKPVSDWNALRYDKNLCIFCERCVKVCWEIQGFGALEIAGNGYGAVIAPTTGEKLDCDFCGQCLAVCPVGAISSAMIFPARSWEVEKVETVCSYCAVGCSLHVNVKKGAVARVTSDDNIGINNGNLCARGRFGYDTRLSEKRIESPCVREGAKLMPVSWDMALWAIAERLRRIKESDGPEALAVIVGERVTNEDAYVLQKMFRAGLGAGRVETLSNIMAPRLNSGIFDEFGSSAPIAGYDEIDKAGSFFFFGLDAEKENPVVANMVRVAMRDRGVPLFVADARAVEFTPRASERVVYNYGEEPAVLAELIACMDKPGQGAVGRLAQGLKQNGQPLIILGTQARNHPRAVDIVRAVLNLAGRLGGKALLLREYCNSQGVNDMGASPTHYPGYLKVDDPEAARLYSKAWGIENLELKIPEHDIFHDLQAGLIKGLLVVGCDPIVDYPDGQFVRESIQRAEFLAVTGAFSGETSALANVVAPTCAAFERDGTYTNNEGRVQMIRKAVAPEGQAWPEWKIFREISNKLGLELTFDSASAVAEEIASVVPGYEGLTHQRISERGGQAAYPAGDSAPDGGFKFNPEPLKTSQDSAFPYLAIVGDSLFHLGSATRHSPAMNRLAPCAQVEMNPEDAQAAKLADGQQAVVESKQGSIKAMVRTTARSPKGVVFITRNFEDAPATHLIYRKDPATMVKIGGSK